VSHHALTTAVIPYIPIEPTYFGFLNTFGLAVAIGVIIGAHFARRYTVANGLDEDVMYEAIPYAVIIGFAISHWFDVLTYQPEVILEDPLILVKFWQGISSVGGMLGGTLGFLYYLHVKRRGTPKLPYCDMGGLGAVISWVFGRLGCTLVHDHPGAPSDFPLAMEFKDGISRHDLGFYEMLWLIVIASTLMLVARWKARPPGLIISLAPLMYAPMRFYLDFLRETEGANADRRYFGLTPAHYMAIAIFAVGAVLLWYTLKHRNDPRPEPEPQPEPTKSKPRKKRK
jgi:phosphatidylglycerol:prolipoprotein diacylglycerol transferase